MRRLIAALAFALWATVASAQVITPVNMRDANLTLSNVQNLVTTLNTFTAQRTLTIAGAGVMNSYYLQFIDTANAINGANTLRIVAADGTLINGQAALNVTAPGVYLFIIPSPTGYSASVIYPLGASTPAGGANGQVQYNNSGFLGGFTMSGDATLVPSTGVITFASVNSNTGTWGGATFCSAFTVNAKGLITAAAQSACTPAIANVTGLGTGVATALAVNIGTAGSFVTNGGALGTPSSGVATNLTGTAAGLTAGTASAVAVGGITGLAAGMSTWLATPSSANLRATLTDETGTGLAYFQGGDIGTPSAGVGTNLTSLNASNLGSGTIPAGRMPALTGDVTSSAGSVATTYNNVVPTAKGGVPQGAWTTFSPSPSCAAGSPTFTSSGRWQQIAPKTTIVEYDVTVTAISTCDSSINTVSMSLPNTSAAASSGAGFDFIGGAAMVCWIPSSGSTSLSCRSITATAAPKLVTTSHFAMTVIYENQ